MNKQTVTLMALFVGWILTADIANAMGHYSKSRREIG